MPSKSRVKRLCAKWARVARERKKKVRQESTESTEPLTADESSEAIASTSSQPTAAAEAIHESDTASDFTYDPEEESYGGGEGAFARHIAELVLTGRMLNFIMSLLYYISTYSEYV